MFFSKNLKLIFWIPINLPFVLLYQKKKNNKCTHVSKIFSKVKFSQS